MTRQATARQTVAHQDVAAERARVDLSRRVLLIGQRVGRADGATLAGEVEAIRRVALANGMYPAASVAHVLEMAIARGERGPLVAAWLQVLADAVRSERTDDAACDTFTAACSVRLAG